MSNDKNIQTFREEIDSIDREILELLNRRAKAAQEIGKIKNHHDADFYIPSREKAVLARLCKMNSGPLHVDAITSVFREVISACRALETQLAVAYLGPEGTYHHSAAQIHFGRSARFIPVERINGIFEEVERNRVNYGIVAIENSLEGSVGVTLDRLVHSTVNIVGEVYLSISHNLISFSELHEIDKVYSHPQGLAQCRRWLESNLPKARLIDAASTSYGVCMCKEDRHAAAVAGALASEIFEVPIQVRAIEDFAGNTTRFFVIGGKTPEPSTDDKTSMIVFVRDKVGALHSMLEPFKNNKVNLTNIVSRPIKQEAWQYMFFLECQGHYSMDILRETIAEIERNSLYVKILGSYPRAHSSPGESVQSSE
ncbi:MAG: prephenate dehydratase [Candidatus Omnitrophota bacterium]|jgi:chorismate mutase/prephenate dehydratase|nr:MAG: prephenate dehydratase [Candidatus Omnitrophota bacterium]